MKLHFSVQEQGGTAWKMETGRSGGQAAQLLWGTCMGGRHALPRAHSAAASLPALHTGARAGCTSTASWNTMHAFLHTGPTRVKGFAPPSSARGGRAEKCALTTEPGSPVRAQDKIQRSPQRATEGCGVWERIGQVGSGDHQSTCALSDQLLILEQI